ncbi:uncharacterized protein LOC122826611 [Gambusia affinis]|uniref:uncharacterized protein LOC122826611 n=1 Tax=Gambusia affinis TaxID=33528 RepID=UPI001CDCA055|nr:uncharacterized protein LOC122826611 [Gambusia affinis]XP_043964634.1 uncharacterized protein LOC122826611 [Gambusia affinis]
MTPPQKAPSCPICEFDFTYLGKHLASKHGVRNKVEKRLLINHASGRVNFRHLPCPVPGCGFSKTRVDRHLEVGHPELDRAQVQEFVRDIKMKVTLDGLRALRASNPSPPVMSSLDIGTDDHEQVHEVADVVESSCSDCQKLTKENKELRQQLRIKQRWAKRAKAKIKALEEALQKAGGGRESGDSDLHCAQEETLPEEGPTQKKAVSATVNKVFKDFAAPILEFMEEYWVHLRGSRGSKKRNENQRSTSPAKRRKTRLMYYRLQKRSLRYTPQRNCLRPRSAKKK